MTSNDNEKLWELLPGLADIARDAGSRILKVYETSFEVETKEDSSPLTLADRESHDVICQRLPELNKPSFLPSNIPVLSEEGRDIPFSERSSWKYFWLVDPLDGTKEFVKRNGEFTVNIALIHDAKPILGIVYIPVTDAVYFGVRGECSYKAEGLSQIDTADILELSRRLPLEGQTDSALRVVGSRSHSSKPFEEYVENLKAEYGEISLVSAGSSLKFCLVAEGKADIYPRLGPTMEWDTAAGHAVAIGAGRQVIKYGSDKELEYNKKELLNAWFICR